MISQHQRVIQRAHSLPGRSRLRMRWLRDAPERAEPLAEHLATLDESIEVVIRPWTGSVLCTYDPERLSEERIVSAIRQHESVAIVLEPGESPRPVRRQYDGGSVRAAVVTAFRELNGEIQTATDGHLDLGALTGLGFLALGAAEIASSRALPAPPWFNVAWWAYRTFTLSGAEPEGEETGDGYEPELSLED